MRSGTDLFPDQLHGFGNLRYVSSAGLCHVRSSAAVAACQLSCRLDEIACLEAIGLQKGWISPARLREVAQPMSKNQYGQYLLKMADEFEKHGPVNYD